MNYKIWNKKDPINGISSELILSKRNDLKNAEHVFIIYKQGVPIEIQIVETIRINYSLDESLTPDEVAQEFLRIKKEEEEDTQKEKVTLEEQAKEISLLKEKNTELSESQKVQDRTILDVDIKMLDMEFVLDNLIVNLNSSVKIDLRQVFNLSRSTTWFNQFKQMIDMENYDSKEDFKAILDKYLDRKRITQKEYDELLDILYTSEY